MTWFPVKLWEHEETARLAGGGCRIRCYCSLFCAFNRNRSRRSPLVIVVLGNLPETHAAQRAHLQFALEVGADELGRLLREILLRHVPHAADAIEGCAHVLRPLVHVLVAQILVVHAPHDPHLGQPADGPSLAHRARESLEIVLGHGCFQRGASGFAVAASVRSLVLGHGLLGDGELVAKVCQLVNVRLRALAHAERAGVNREGIGELVPGAQRGVHHDDPSEEPWVGGGEEERRL
mmetsp:Transcript_3404/g.13560  ORF Transcript_3404/g.13560 Transcript_3404/m.13560 type:complete len:236 (+) Transcript_3404:777-1484(+)